MLGYKVKADFYIICVSDDAILEISDKLIFKDSIIVHTSGSTRIDILSKHKNHGVLYPLQTFSKNRELSFKNIPIIIEASSKKVLNEIKKISLQLSKNVIVCNSDQRTLIHISAVFSNNLGARVLLSSPALCFPSVIPLCFIRF